jgi:hypothetical protein
LLSRGPRIFHAVRRHRSMISSSEPSSTSPGVRRNVDMIVLAALRALAAELDAPAFGDRAICVNITKSAFSARASERGTTRSAVCKVKYLFIYRVSSVSAGYQGTRIRSLISKSIESETKHGIDRYLNYAVITSSLDGFRGDDVLNSSVLLKAHHTPIFRRIWTSRYG